MTDLIFNTNDPGDVSSGSTVTINGAAPGPNGTLDNIQISDGFGNFISTVNFTYSVSQDILTVGDASANMVFDNFQKTLTIGDASAHLIFVMGNPAIIGAPNRNLFIVAGGASVQTVRSHINLEQNGDVTVHARDAIVFALDGNDTIIEGGNAFATTGTGNGGDVILRPGSPTLGPGVDGVVNVDNGDFQIAGTTVLTDGLVLQNVLASATIITSDTFVDARIAQSNVTQHEAALSITESQISDFQNYLVVTNGTFQTTDATLQTVETIVIPDNDERVIIARVRGHEDATDDSIWAVIHFGVKNVGGAVSLIGTATIDTDGDAGTVTWGGVSVGVSGANALIQVTGEAAHTINWESTSDAT